MTTGKDRTKIGLWVERSVGRALKALKEGLLSTERGSVDLPDCSDNLPKIIAMKYTNPEVLEDELGRCPIIGDLCDRCDDRECEKGHSQMCGRVTGSDTACSTCEHLKPAKDEGGE